MLSLAPSQRGGGEEGPFFVRAKVYVASLRKTAPPGPPGGAVGVRKENDRILNITGDCPRRYPDIGCQWSIYNRMGVAEVRIPYI